MNEIPKQVITRFAPSPTGFMHIGGVRTALFAFLYARQNNGTFILRIEDTDKNREVEGSIDHIMQSLKWLKLDWDYGPDKPTETPFGSVIQSQRLDSYKKYAHKLIEKGLAYPDPYTSSELERFREQANAEKRPFLFRDHRPETFGIWDGTTALRLKTPEIKRYHWYDQVRGDLEAGPEMLDDFILIKADGYPTYNFAHIVDDLEMKVTHVMRGEEFISSTPKFLSLYDALEIPYPKFVTMPPIMGPDGKKKLSKRDGAKDLLDYKTEGYLPETMVNFLALTGWNPGTPEEVFSMEDLIKKFSITQIQSSGAAFNEEKLLWMNKEHLKKVKDEDFLSTIISRFPDNLSNSPYFSIRLPKLLPVIRDRIHIYQEVSEEAKRGEYDFAFLPIDYDVQILKWKNDESVIDVKPRLEKVIEILNNEDFFNPESIKEAIWPFAEATGKGEVLWPLRVALTGQERSPDPFSCAFILGKEETLQRIKTACDKILI
jgi:glutamyl-tRNA synthetase